MYSEKKRGNNNNNNTSINSKMMQPFKSFGKRFLGRKLWVEVWKFKRIFILYFYCFKKMNPRLLMIQSSSWWRVSLVMLLLSSNQLITIDLEYPLVWSGINLRNGMVRMWITRIISCRLLIVLWVYLIISLKDKMKHKHKSQQTVSILTWEVTLLISLFWLLDP